MNNDFKIGEYIIYQNGDRCEIGKIKRITDDGAFVWYHEGETASKTPFDCMHKIINGYTISDTTLGKGNNAIESRMWQIFNTAYNMNNSGNGTDLSRMCTSFLPEVMQNMHYYIDKLQEFGYEIRK